MLFGLVVQKRMDACQRHVHLCPLPAVGVSGVSRRHTFLFYQVFFPLLSPFHTEAMIYPLLFRVVMELAAST